MRTIEIRVNQASLADTLSAMREWLDREKCYLSHFRHTNADDGTIVISASFSNDYDPRIDAFQRQFGGAG
jgi:hypothetical protein